MSIINWRGHMNTSQINLPPSGRRRGRYSNEFKQNLVEACLAPGVSTASIALANGINANLLRRWVSESTAARGSQIGAAAHSSQESSASDHPGFVRLHAEPSPAEYSSAPGALSAVRSDLELEFRYRDTMIFVRGSVAHCASFVRSVVQ